VKGICRFCGQTGEGQPFGKWVKPTFTNWDKLVNEDIACNDCLFWFDEASMKLAECVGKPNPQRMRNSPHFIKCGEWTPLSKGNKVKMIELLTTPSFPELAVIADSGQKHIVFQAMRNPHESKADGCSLRNNGFGLSRKS
jgi:hypothetical protein